MKVMWIGHGGLLFVSGKNKILIDPYLSNSLRLDDKFFKRRTRIKASLYALKPDVIVMTSAQKDRADLKTIRRLSEGPFWFLGQYNIFGKYSKYRPTILASEGAFNKAKSLKLKHFPLTMFESGCEWSLGDMTIKAVPAITSDLSAFGLIITDNEDGKKYYVASNTLYCEELIESLPKDIYCGFFPIGGIFGSMNAIDASRFAKALNPEYAVPVQFGTIDRVKPEQFIVGGRIIPKIYKIIDFNSPDGPSVSNSGINVFFNEKSSKKMKNQISSHSAGIDSIKNDLALAPQKVEAKKDEPKQIEQPKAENLEKLAAEKALLAKVESKVEEKTATKVEAKTNTKVEAKADTKVEAKTDAKVEAKAESKPSTTEVKPVEPAKKAEEKAAETTKKAEEKPKETK